jgi:hypothetical protein
MKFVIAKNKPAWNFITLTVTGCLLWLLSTPAVGQISQEETPPGLKHELSLPVESVIMQAVDVESILQEEQIKRQQGKPHPPRFGYAHHVELNPGNSGEWVELPEGKHLWRLRIKSPSAYTMHLVFHRYQLPEDGKLFIYNSDKSTVWGAFMSDNNREHGKFSIPPIPGNELIVEYLVNDQSHATSELEIGKVIHGFFDFNNQMNLGFGESFTCNVNVNCPGASVSDHKRAIGLLVGGQDNDRICSGALINNEREDYTSYFLTAQHCLDAEQQPNIPPVEEWSVVFNYETACNSNNDPGLSDFVSGTQIRADLEETDFLLLELDAIPPSHYNTYLLGWDRDENPANHTTGIHHPAGDIKMRSHDNDPPVSSDFFGDNPVDSHWEVDFDIGTVEWVSSGSPLLNPNNKVIGQLHGGTPADRCEFRDGHYGKFYRSWDYEQFDQTMNLTDEDRLRDWLDPDNTNIMSLDGRYAQPHAPQNFVITNAGAQGQPPHLEWDANSEDDLSHYEVWRRILNLQSQFQLIATTTSTSYTDNSAFQDSQGQETRYYIKAVNDFDRSSVPSNHYTVYLQTPHLITGSDNDEMIPNEFALHQNYPNPFNPTTNIRYELPETAQVVVEVYNLLGQMVVQLVNESQSAGLHDVHFDASSLSSGIYLVNLSAEAESGLRFKESRSMFLIK